MRATEQESEEALAYVRSRLATDAVAFGEPLRTRPGVDRMLTELDGCAIRTGALESVEDSEETPVRGLPRRRRVEEWREVREARRRRSRRTDATRRFRCPSRR